MFSYIIKELLSIFTATRANIHQYQFNNSELLSTIQGILQFKINTKNARYKRNEEELEKYNAVIWLKYFLKCRKTSN